MNPILEVQDIQKTFFIKPGVLSPKRSVRAVRKVSFSVYPGDCFGLIGESGSGKTTVGNLISRLEQLDSGHIQFLGQELPVLSASEMRGVRKNLQVVFQQSKESLDAKRTIGALLEEPLVLHRGLKGKAAEKEVKALLEQVGMRPGDRHKVPGELSGGQRQRIGIARALSTQPELLILDEPTSALDVSVQGQILNLLQRLQQDLGLTYILITHDLKVVRKMCNRVGVMSAGELVEQGQVDRVFDRPEAPYTKQLLGASQLVRED